MCETRKTASRGLQASGVCMKRARLRLSVAVCNGNQVFQDTRVELFSIHYDHDKRGALVTTAVFDWRSRCAWSRLLVTMSRAVNAYSTPSSLLPAAQSSRLAALVEVKP